MTSGVGGRQEVDVRLARASGEGWTGWEQPSSAKSALSNREGECGG